MIDPRSTINDLVGSEILEKQVYRMSQHKTNCVRETLQFHSFIALAVVSDMLKVSQGMDGSCFVSQCLPYYSPHPHPHPHAYRRYTTL